jgi:hypothetical protein
LLRVGFAVPRDVVLARGALLPHRFTITTHPATPLLLCIPLDTDLAVERYELNVKSGNGCYAAQG